jgi:hypothetical protein
LDRIAASVQSQTSLPLRTVVAMMTTLAKDRLDVMLEIDRRTLALHSVQQKHQADQR